MDVDITNIRQAEESMRRQRDQLAALHGTTLAYKLQSSFPQLRVILMSGYLQRVMANGSEPSYPVLNKPFTRHQLFALIRQTISRAR